MNRHSRYHLSLEALENRYCPALTASLDLAGNLNISGTPTAPADTLLINETAPDTFSVNDGATLLGTFFVTGNINVRLNTIAATTTEFLNLNGNATPGAVTFNLGSGPNDLTVSGGGGMINGNLTVNSGASNDLVLVNAVTVNGNVSANLGGSTGGDDLSLFGTTVNGNLTGSNVDAFELDATSSVGGTASLSDLKGVLVNYSFDAGSTVLGNAIVNTNTGFSSALLNFAGSVGLNLVATVGKGNSIIDLAAGASVGGSASFLAGTSSPSNSIITVDAAFIGGNLLIQQGTGTSLAQVLAGATILGTSVRYQGAAGNHTFDFNGSAPGAQLYAYMGSGIQSFALTPGAVLAGGQVIYGPGTTTTSLAPVVNFPFHVRNT